MMKDKLSLAAALLVAMGVQCSGYAAVHDDALGAAFGVVSLHHAHNNQFVFPHFGVALVLSLIHIW